ncbi:AEC family transporter [Flavonifractor plautii]|nr:AEC family transporter [Flavonifractor plautii]
MLSNLLTVTGQVATLFLMMAVGFVLGRAGKITEAGRSQMSYLLLYIVCPCVMVDCFLVKRTPALTQEVAVGSAAALACYLLFSPSPCCSSGGSWMPGHPAFCRGLRQHRLHGAPLVQSILGEEALVYGALALLAFNLTSWTLGVLIMGGRAAFSCAGRCSTQVLSASGSGCFAFSAACAFPPRGSGPLLPERPEHPLAMVVIGTQLAEAHLPSTFRQPRNYLVSFLRLALFPTLTALLLLLRSSSGLYCALVLLSATPVAGTTSLFAQQFGRDTAPAAESITLSTLLSILTLPLFAVLARGISMF